MSHTPSQRKRDQHVAAIQTEADRRKTDEDGAERRLCQPIIRAWNAHAARRRPSRFYPTIGAALAAGAPILTFMCPACRLVDKLDLRTVDRHPAATIGSLIPSLSCHWCRPNTPFARLLSLREGPAR